MICYRCVWCLGPPADPLVDVFHGGRVRGRAAVEPSSSRLCFVPMLPPGEKSVSLNLVTKGRNTDDRKLCDCLIWILGTLSSTLLVWHADCPANFQQVDLTRNLKPHFWILQKSGELINNMLFQFDENARNREHNSNSDGIHRACIKAHARTYKHTGKPKGKHASATHATTCQKDA